MLILFELSAGERLASEEAHPWYLRPGRPISASAVPFGPGIDIGRSCRFFGAMMRFLCMLPGGLGRFIPCAIGAKHCRLMHLGWEQCGYGVTSRPRRVAHATAAARRRQRRLRQFLRLTVAMLLAERDHHTAPRGQKQARSGEGRNETHYTAEFWETSLPSRSASSCSRKSPAGRRPRLSLSLGRRSGYSGTPWSDLPTSLPWCRFSMYLSRGWWTNWWTYSRSSTLPRAGDRSPVRFARLFLLRRWRSSCWKWHRKWWLSCSRPSAFQVLALVVPLDMEAS